MKASDDDLDSAAYRLAGRLTALVDSLPELGAIPVDLTVERRTCVMCRQQLPERAIA